MAEHTIFENFSKGAPREKAVLSVPKLGDRTCNPGQLKQLCAFPGEATRALAFRVTKSKFVGHFEIDRNKHHIQNPLWASP